MASHRKELKLGIDKRDVQFSNQSLQLVNFSVKAQDQILRAAAEGIVGGSYNTQGINDDLSPGQQYQGVSKILNSLGMGGTNLTTQMSQQDGDPSKMMSGTHNKSIINEGGNDLLLPSIKSNRKQQQSPFKQNGGQNTFFDLPMMLATQKMMRQTVRAADKMAQGASGQDFNTQNSAKISSPNETARHNSQSMRATQSADRNMSVKMNPKVLETWINETLQDAEHLDIPGVILKPEHKNPISRYGIDRLALTNAGIPNELVDRIFRALFVYSVGFYELVKKCLQHTERRYSIITAIWKVFSILLEYCCKTDYRMLISEISKEHKDEIDRLEKEFQAKFSEQAANERILKQNMEILQKYTEELEKAKNSETQMRLKLEEEYMQNTKNHEEEVQLRLKFESKLNNMHSVHRDLETKYKRALSELAGLQTINEQLYNKTNAQGEEITALKTLKAEMESKINYNDEKIQGLNREVSIKLKQVQDLEGKFTSAQDELDLTKYKLQELQKDITENKLKIDVYESQVVGLKNEKQHLLLELKETKDLQKVYEKKCGTLLQDINKVNLEFQESKREIIGFGEIQKEREERLEKQKIELKELRAKFEDLDLRHGTLTIHHDKVKEQYETCKRDLDDAIEKLHLTNKVRHETELRLNEETERARSLQDVIRDKDDQLHKRAQEIEDLEKQVVELQRTNDNLEVKKASIERQAEVNKKQLSDKISNLNEILTSEKETREMWIERYEKEQKEHTQTNANLLNTKSQLKDQILATKNVEIKLQTTMKQNEVLTEQNTRLQDQLNEALASQENLERDVNTQKEIMKQMESNRKEYIQKLKSDLLSVESRFTQKIEYMEMVSQDFHSRAAQNLIQFQIQKSQYEETKATLEDTTKKLEDTTESLRSTQSSLSNSEMQCEDLQSQISFNILDRQKALQSRIDDLLEEKKSLEDNIEKMQSEIEAKVKLENQLQDYLNEIKLLKSEMLGIKKERDKLQNIVNNHSAAAEEQRLEFEKQMQVRPETQQSSAKEVIMMQTSGPQVVPEAPEVAEVQPQLQKQSSQTQSKPTSRASHGKGTPQASAQEIRQATPQSAMNVKQVQQITTNHQVFKPQGREMQTQTDLRMSDIDRPQQPLVMRMQPNFVGNNNQYNPTSNDIFKNQILTGNENQQQQMIMQNQQNYSQVQSPMNQNQQIQQNQFNQQYYQNPSQGVPIQNMMVDPTTGQQVQIQKMQQNQLNTIGTQNDLNNGQAPQYGLQIQTDFNNPQQQLAHQTQLTSPYNQTQAFTNMGADPNSTLSSQQLGFNNTFNNGAAFSSTLQSPMNNTQQFHQYQQQQQQFQNQQQNVIHEQAIEEDEYHIQMTNEQRSQYSQQSTNQMIKQQNSSLNGTPMNRLQSNNRMQVDFKNMNSVMQKNPSLSQVSNNSGGSQQKVERKGTASQVSQKTPTGYQINNQYQPQVSQLSNPQMMQQQQYNQQQQQQQFSQIQNYSPQLNQEFVQQNLQQQNYQQNQQMTPNQQNNFQQNPIDFQQQQQYQQQQYQNMSNQGYPQNMPIQQLFTQNQGQFDQQHNMGQQQMMNQQQYTQQQQHQQQQYQQQQNPQYQQQYQQQYPHQQQQQMQQQVVQNQGNMMNQNNPQFQNNIPQVDSSINGGVSVNQNQGGVPQFQNNQISQVQQQQQLNSNSQQMTADEMKNLQMHQQQQAPQPHMRLKVDINSNSYVESQRKNLNSGGGMSVHTPMSQVSGYSQHLAPQNGRFQQQPQIISQQNNASPNQLMVQQQPSNVIVNQNHQSGEKKDNRQVTGKSSIRTLIKAAATRDY